MALVRLRPGEAVTVAHCDAAAPAMSVEFTSTAPL
jgi:hypothetical protein